MTGGLNTGRTKGVKGAMLNRRRSSHPETTPGGRRHRFPLLVIPAGILLILFIYYPIVRGSLLAFQRYNMFDMSDTGFAGFANFRAVINDPLISFGRVLLNTLLWVSVSLTAQFTLGFILALLMREKFPGRGIYAGLVFCTWALSGFAIGLVWAWLFNGQFGLINDILIRSGLSDAHIGFLAQPRTAMAAVIITNVWYGIPFFGIMLLAALQSVPKELYESARIDGAGYAMRLFGVTIPYIAPIIVSTTLLRTIWIMNFPDIIYAMTGGGPANSTNILATQMITTVFKQYDYGRGAAVGLIIIAVLFIYAVFHLHLTAKTGEVI